MVCLYIIVVVFVGAAWDRHYQQMPPTSWFGLQLVVFQRYSFRSSFCSCLLLGIVVISTIFVSIIELLTIYHYQFFSYNNTTTHYKSGIQKLCTQQTTVRHHRSSTVPPSSFCRTSLLLLPASSDLYHHDSKELSVLDCIIIFYRILVC